MRIPSGAARRPDHRRESVADLATRSLLSFHPSWKGNVLSAAACRMYRGRARPSCHGGGGCWAGGQKSSYNARYAGVAQLVERRLPKPEVASSRLVARSTFLHRRLHRVGGHGVQPHGRHPKVYSRRHPGRFPAEAASAFQRQAPISSPPGFPGNASIRRGITCRRRRVRAVPVAGLPADGLDPTTWGRIGITSAACAGSESRPEPGQVHECRSRACPARKRRVPALPAHDRAAPGRGAVTVSRAAPAGHAGWRHLPSARTTLR